MNVIVPAVLAGNAVLVKHASQTALVADQFERAFLEAGGPVGLVQATPMDHATTARLIGSRVLGYVSFTGSVRGGHEIYRAVAKENFIQAGMELGGKDPLIVFEDAHLERAVDGAVYGAFTNAGQVWYQQVAGNLHMPGGVSEHAQRTGHQHGGQDRQTIQAIGEVDGVRRPHQHHHHERHVEPAEVEEQGLDRGGPSGETIGQSGSIRWVGPCIGTETPETNYRRTIAETSLATGEDGYTLTFTGNGFLYRMVRMLITAKRKLDIER